MIELTAPQIEALGGPGGVPPRAINPATRETYVIIPLADYRRLSEADYDDSGWTREELEAQMWALGAAEGWDGADDYDDSPSQS